MKPMPLLSLACAALLAVSLTTGTASAQYPDKPIHLIIPFAPGGGTDIVGRLMAENLSKELKQPFVVENKPGAGAMLGAEFVAKAAPDGYTLLMGTSAELTIGPNMATQARYDPVRDFAPIGMVGASPNVLLAHPSFEPRTIQELAAYAKKNPDKVSMGNGGAGTSPHMSGELLSSLGIPMAHIPYKGTGPALADVVAGHTQLMMSTMAPALPMVRAQKVRAIAVTSLKRSPQLPDTPTVAEQGIPGYEAVTWYAILAPAATPPAVQERLRGALDNVLKNPAVLAKLEELGIVHDDARESSKAIQQRVQNELAQWGKLIKERSIKVN
jgi:tripartite-type tricarboxylate transporter receptor subunit TctC